MKTAVVHRRLADQLWQADQTAVPIPPLTDQHPDLSIEDAYAIQSVNIDRRIQNGERICGRKIGLTSQPMQELLGVDEPDYGVLLDGMFVEDGDEIDLGRLVQPRVEAEMAFIMERDLEGPGANTASALRAIAGVLPAVEIVDSRVADWKIKLVDTVADNASSGLIVMGGRYAVSTNSTCDSSASPFRAAASLSTPAREPPLLAIQHAVWRGSRTNLRRSARS